MVISTLLVSLLYQINVFVFLKIIFLQKNENIAHNSSFLLSLDIEMIVLKCLYIAQRFCYLSTLKCLKIVHCKIIDVGVFAHGTLKIFPSCCYLSTLKCFRVVHWLIKLCGVVLKKKHTYC